MYSPLLTVVLEGVEDLFTNQALDLKVLQRDIRGFTSFKIEIDIKSTWSETESSVRAS